MSLMLTRCTNNNKPVVIIYIDITQSQSCPYNKIVTMLHNGVCNKATACVSATDPGS